MNRSLCPLSFQFIAQLPPSVDASARLGWVCVSVQEGSFITCLCLNEFQVSGFFLSVLAFDNVS